MTTFHKVKADFPDVDKWLLIQFIVTGRIRKPPINSYIFWKKCVIIVQKDYKIILLSFREKSQSNADYKSNCF